MNCAETIDRMGDEIEGCLAGDLRAGFDEHLEECAPCRNYLEQLRLTRRTLESLPPTRARNERLSKLIDEFRKEFED